MPVCVVFSVVLSAPVDHEVDKKAVIGNRESTNAILNLEQQLKAQAGENKKFFPSQGSHPVAQVDGLSDAAQNSGEETKPSEDEPSKNLLSKEEETEEDAVPVPAAAEVMKNPEEDEPVVDNVMMDNHNDDEAELREAAMMDQSRDIMDDDILELLRENPELWDEVVSGKLY